MRPADDMRTKNAGARAPLPDPAPWLVHLLILALVLFFFRDILLRTAFFWEDFLYQYYAFRSFAAVSLAAGELPLWNPYTFNGMPFQADIQSAIFYLPNLLLTPFASGGALDYWWVEFSMILHFALAGSGMVLLARSVGLDGWSALFSGIAYCFSGFLVAHLIHQGFLYQAAWFPLVVLMFRRGMLERSWTSAVAAGLLLGHALLAGAPQITLYILLFLFLLVLFEAAPVLRRDGPVAAARMAPFAALPVAIALLATAVQLLPTAELAPLSQRAEITYERAVEGSFSPSLFMTLAVPKYFGTSGAQGLSYLGPGPYWLYWETAGYIGVAALAFAVAGALLKRRDPFVRFLSAVVLVGFLYAVGDTLFVHRLFHDFVPGFDTFRVPGRMVLYFSFCGSLLAGFGLAKVIALSRERPRSLTTFALGIAGGAAALVMAGQAGLFVVPHTGAAGAEAARLASAESLKAAGFLVAAAALLVLLARGIVPARIFAAAMIILQVADAHAFGFTQNNGRLDPDAYYGRTAAMVGFFREQGQEEYFRINSREGGAMLLDRNQGMLDRIFLMEGYTPLGLARFIPPMSTWERTCDLMNAKYRISVDHSTGSMGMIEAQRYVPRAFVAHRARVVGGPDEAKAALSDSAFDPMAEVVFEQGDIGGHRVRGGSPPGAGGEGAAPPAPAGEGTAPPAGSATITSYRLNEIRLVVETPAHGYLVLSEVWYPGWRASVDGAEAPVLRADWCLRAVPVDAGRREVTLSFSPDSFRTGAWISTLTVALSAAGLIYGRTRRRA